MDNDDWFVPVGLILGLMNRGEGGFDGFSISNLATAVEISEPLHIDRFDRLRKAPEDVVTSFLDGLAEYYVSINYLEKTPDELRALALAENWDGARSLSEKLFAHKREQTRFPPGSHSIGWMHSRLATLVEEAKAATEMAPPNNPAAKRAYIVKRVDEGVRQGKPKESMYKQLANELGKSHSWVKELYLDAKKRTRQIPSK